MSFVGQLIFYWIHLAVFYLYSVWVPLNEFLRKFNLFKNYRRVTIDDPDFPKSLIGKICIITGGTRGLGFDVVKALLTKGCHVITGSSASKEAIFERHEQIIKELGEDNKGVLEIWQLDLASMNSVVQFCETIKSRSIYIDYIICNGGIMMTPRKVTEDGQEAQLAINYLSHCLMIWLLLPKINRTEPDGSVDPHRKSRIVLVSSVAHESAHYINFDDMTYQKYYSPHHAYSQSKTALIMLAIKMNEYFNEHQLSNYITINSLHPGLCWTDLMNSFSLLHYWFIKLFPVKRSQQEGADEIIYAALSSELESISGVYLDCCSVKKSSSLSKDKSSQDRLWKLTWEFLSQWTPDTPIGRLENTNNMVKDIKGSNQVGASNPTPNLIQKNKIAPSDFVVVNAKYP